MSKKNNKNRGSSLDDLLKKEGGFGQCQSAAIKEVIAWQLAEETGKTKTVKDGDGRAHEYQQSSGKPLS